MKLGKRLFFMAIVVLVLLTATSCMKKKGVPKTEPAGVTMQSQAAPYPAEAERLASVWVDPQALAAKQRELMVPGGYKPLNTEEYGLIVDNSFLSAEQNPLSTFSVDVDTASYANVRRFLNSGQRPPKDAVRIEEMVNYFPYAYPAPQGEATPFLVQSILSECPWETSHRLLRIALKGREMERKELPPSNLVFLLDVSGSMSDPNKLPLVKQAMMLLVSHLSADDRVAIVVYAGASGVALPSTRCTEENKEEILQSLIMLSPGGSTHGSQGIELAYEIAGRNFIKDGANRVILATDGDFNVGLTDEGSLVRLIEEKAESGVFLTVLGFGMDNLQDSTMEQLADKENGNYGYIDTIHEARKMFVEDMHATLFTIAKDVKIQVEFNPAKVAEYRLIGYENRTLAAEDFKDDKKDAGEIGAGHTVTALYEIAPVGASQQQPGVDPLKYQKPRDLSRDAQSDELALVKLRYKEPDGDASVPTEFVVKDDTIPLEEAGEDFQFAASVAAFGMLLRESEYKGACTYDMVLDLARSGKGGDPYNYRGEFINLVLTGKAVSGK